MSRTVRIAFVWAALVTCFAARAADDNKVIYPGGAASSPSSIAAPAAPSLGNMTLVLGVALAAVGAWFVWRGRRSAPLGRDNNHLTVGETRSLGNRQFLVVATYEDKKFLLGVCPGRIDMLAPLHDEKPRA